MTTLPSDLIRREASALTVRPSAGLILRARPRPRLLGDAIALVIWALLGVWLLTHPRPADEVSPTTVLLGLALGVLTDFGPVSLLFALGRFLRCRRGGRS